MSNNGISQYGGLAWSDTLWGNASLAHLNLSDNPLGDEVAVNIAGVMSRNQVCAPRNPPSLAPLCPASASPCWQGARSPTAKVGRPQGKQHRRLGPALAPALADALTCGEGGMGAWGHGGTDAHAARPGLVQDLG